MGNTSSIPNPTDEPAPKPVPNTNKSFKPPRELIDSAANMAITSHHQRIRFMHLLGSLMEPEVFDTLTQFYDAEHLETIKSQSLTLYAKFRLAEEELVELDEIKRERKWMRRYKDGKWRFEEAVRLLKQFEAKSENLAVEWQVQGMRPVPWVEHGGLYPGVEDLDMEEVDARLALDEELRGKYLREEKRLRELAELNSEGAI
jgi:hypothetical protein